MYPVVYGDEKTRKAILLYTLTLLPTVASLFYFDKAGYIYFLTAVLLTGKFVWDAILLYRDHNNTRAMPFFYYSCSYTFILFLALAIDRMLVLPQ